jgi:putative ABC transport system substrate-binding protein
MMLRRRGLLGATVVSLLWPVLARAQAKPRYIGLLHVGDDHVPPSYKPMLEEMARLGYREGVDVRYDFRNVADDKSVVEAARALVRGGVEVIVAFDQEACGAAHKATTTIPVVMMHASNPLGGGFAKSLARPGGNMTGFAGRPELPAKELQILKEIAPKLRRVLLLVDSRDPASVAWANDTKRAAKELGVTLIERDVFNPADLNPVFEKLKPGEAEAALFASNVIRHRYQRQVLKLSQERGIAVVGARKDVVEVGALFSYSYDFAKIGRAAPSRYLIPVLKGTKPADLPIEEVTEYELVVNAGVARKHGWTLSTMVRERAVRVIE